MKQYFIADTHFGHDKFHSENWEKKFWKKYDQINQDFILYILGDLSFVYNHEYLDNIFKKFRNNKYLKNIVLVLGNHDDKASRYLQHNVVTCDFMHITYKKKRILLTHEPFYNPIEVINIHGHLHNKEASHRNKYILNDKNILVESEKIYSIDELIKESR